MRTRAHARKNIYERLIGILVHSNNCCAHLTNKNHIGNKFLVCLVIIQYCVLMDNPLTVWFATSSAYPPTFHTTTTTETQSMLADSPRKQKERCSTHAASCAHLPHCRLCTEWAMAPTGGKISQVFPNSKTILASLPLPCFVIRAVVCILSKIISRRGHQEGRVQRWQRHVVRAHAWLLCRVLAEGATSD